MHPSYLGQTEERWGSKPNGTQGFLQRSPPKERSCQLGNSLCLLAWEHLCIPLEELEEVSREMEVWVSAAPTTWEQEKKMDG